VEALEQQTATSDILRVISHSQTDVQPVFDTIATCAARLCEGEFCHVFRFDGTLIITRRRMVSAPKTRHHPQRLSDAAGAGMALPPARSPAAESNTFRTSPPIRDYAHRTVRKDHDLSQHRGGWPMLR
jgi:hypothetical protein